MTGNRHRTFPIHVSNLEIGGNNPIIIQSMTNTRTHELENTLAQINELYNAGCQVVRVAVPDKQAIQTLPLLVAKSPVPLVADIHFNYQLAIDAIKSGVSKIRINPGNIGSVDKVSDIVSVAKEFKVPIRIGINSGSLEKSLLDKYGGPTHMALVESAVNNVMMLSKMNFHNVIVSIKASDVMTTIRANQEFAKRLSNPLHLGITEAGTIKQGTIKSAAGIGSLLAQGIGDTIRVSLSGSPVDEVEVAKTLLSSLGLSKGVEIISCPTCGRTDIDVEQLALEVEKLLSNYQVPIKVAVMGCAVNGPGEAKEADLGVAGAKDYGVLFKKGKIVKKVPRDELMDILMTEIEQAAQLK
ncbi:flavodoxin-dependent (E)-4-hydroxy-3-methylbut-2-enyl-diphosphate synthase [Natranaerobius trueperi]|uniref:4-hydroxy-3-methylbut-2-en-1-yl diphosphate synthase (flavodoxin) n=1 Tax=Natranaerobius trueperi TaxID=759412 RepID=A0A226C1F4_9FIRM|nr:flavodoxin-dependent (E)-4-hydroxy-3-methylbut-2-enyl-diphosphate synthase [Natranaerobius trueperi]OWZ84269.1 4-hydroxy-3-methylbut-2-en-1-yl diphosphate synthase [Natranaerobius trueperi]